MLTIPPEGGLAKSSKHNNHQIPTFYRRSSIYLLKASYQRNMLIGLLCTVLIVGIPVLVFACWPVEEKPPITDDGTTTEAPDTVVINLPLDKEIIILPEEKSTLTGVRRSNVEGALGTFVHRVISVSDQFEIDDEEPVFGPREEEYLTPGPGILPGLGNGGGSGVVFVRDTTIYEISSELDRKPTLVAMEKPEYPPLAKRAGVEGTVILHVWVGIDGFVENVKVISESNPGYGFGRYAVEAARSAVFTPALYNNQPVRCLVSFPVEFVFGK